MVQCANYAGLLTSLSTVEEVLDHHASELGHDFIEYRNHVYRVVNLCVAIVGDRGGVRARQPSQAGSPDLSKQKLATPELRRGRPDQRDQRQPRAYHSLPLRRA